MFKIKIKSAFALSVAAVTGLVTVAVAKPNVGVSGGGGTVKFGQHMIGMALDGKAGDGASFRPPLWSRFDKNDGHNFPTPVVLF